MVLPRGSAAVGAAALAAVALMVLIMPGASAHGFSQDIPPGGEFRWPFVAVHEFQYHCHKHPWMTGVVVVLPAPEEHASVTHNVSIVEPEADPQSWGYEPARLEVFAGDFVRWVNEGQQLHDVTDESAHVHGDGSQNAGHNDHDAPVGLVMGLLALMFAVVAAARRRHT